MRRRAALVAVAAGIGLIAVAEGHAPTPSSAAHASPGVIATIPVDTGPWNVAVNEVTNRVYVVHKNRLKVTVIDGTNNAVISIVDIACCIRMFGIAVDQATNKVYVASEDDPTITVIDGNTNSVTGSITGTSSGTRHLAVNPAISRLYVTHNGGLLVVDTDSGQPVTDIVLAGADGVAVNPATGRVYVSDASGGVTSVISAVTNQVVDTIPAGGSSVAVDSASNRVYLSYGMTVVDGATNEVIATVPGSSGADVDVNSSTERIYTTTTVEEAHVVGGSSNSITDTLIVGQTPWGVAVNPSTDRVYIANLGGGSVSVIGDNGDADLDTVLNAGDNCPNWPNTAQNLPAWTVPPGDPDCDGFSTSNETTIGTFSFVPCDGTTTANDESYDAWPPDFDDSKSVNITDVLALKPVFGTGVPPASARLDIQPGNGINIGDVLAMKPFFNMSC
jgi:YVTN family beta-propeller protein